MLIKDQAAHFVQPDLHLIGSKGNYSCERLRHTEVVISKHFQVTQVYICHVGDSEFFIT